MEYYVSTVSISISLIAGFHIHAHMSKVGEFYLNSHKGIRYNTDTMLSQ